MTTKIGVGVSPMSKIFYLLFPAGCNELSLKKVNYVEELGIKELT